jgi:hypothetical protein
VYIQKERPALFSLSPPHRIAANSIRISNDRPTSVERIFGVFLSRRQQCAKIKFHPQIPQSKWDFFLHRLAAEHVGVFLTS